MSFRILIADDHGVLRAGLHALLSIEPDLEVVGEAADGREVLRLARELNPDVVLLDLVMPGLGGIEVTRQLKKLLPDTRVLILTVHEDASLASEAMQAGAEGYLIKRAVESELVDAIHAVCRGDLYLHPALTRSLLKNLPSAPASSVSSLSPLERSSSCVSLPRDIPTVRSLRS